MSANPLQLNAIRQIASLSTDEGAKKLGELLGDNSARKGTLKASFSIFKKIVNQLDDEALESYVTTHEMPMVKLSPREMEHSRAGWFILDDMWNAYNDALDSIAENALDHYQEYLHNLTDDEVLENDEWKS
ncbi:MAG: hypothetical protein HYV07_27675 [Deltaproteobacteria bacterium]|nr:hypothetical protein [Deltaproteobacteria bacterium]